MIDKSAFHSLSYGMYVIGAHAQNRDFGCVVNTFAQVTSSPMQMSVALNKENATMAAVREAGRFTASCLSEDATMELIGTFGFHTSTELDKFAQHASARDAAGMPLCGRAGVRHVLCEGGYRVGPGHACAVHRRSGRGTQGRRRGRSHDVCVLSPGQGR